MPCLRINPDSGKTLKAFREITEPNSSHHSATTPGKSLARAELYQGTTVFFGRGRKDSSLSDPMRPAQRPPLHGKVSSAVPSPDR
jgi:hypothetical protein